MKKIALFVAALAAVCSCSKNEMTTVDGKTVTIVAESNIDNGTKVTMGAKDNGVYPMSWNESGECVFLREVVRSAASNADCGSSAFKKIDAKTASFTFTLESKTTESTYDYAAVYPCDPTDYKTSLDHGVRYGGTDAKNRVSYILNHEKSQLPLADAPDPATNIMVATALNFPSQPASLALDFNYVVGFGKMTVKNFPALAAGETVSKITITVPEDQKMTGRLYHYFHENSDGTHKAGDIIPYSSTTVKNFVMVDPKNITFNTTGFDVWFTSFPVSLVADDYLSLSFETSVKTYTANIKLTKQFKIEAGKVSEFVYDYEKGQPQAETKTLTFDFSTCPEGWPSGADEYKSKDHSTKTLPYVLGGVTYNFISAVCLDLASTSTRSIAWGYDGSNAQNYFVAQPERFFGLPAIEGWKLVTFKFTQACSTNKDRKVCVTSAITNQKQQSAAYVTGGEPQAVTTQGTEYTYNLTGTQANTVYYFAPTAKGNGFATITLVYEKVAE